MKPFLVFRAPNHHKWRFHPKGKKRFRFNAWVVLPYSKEKVTQEIITKDSIELADLLPMFNETVNAVMDELQCELYQHWATFLLSINNTTTDEEIDRFYDSVPDTDYGYEVYVWS